MDPITHIAIGQIRQREFIEQAERDHQGEQVGIVRGVSSLWRLVRATVRRVFQPATCTPECAQQTNLLTDIR